MSFLQPISQLSKKLLTGLVTLMLFIAFSSVADTTGKYGILRKNETQFPINDIAYRVDEARHQLAVFLSATPLTEDVREGFEKGDMSMGMFLHDKPSPDKTKWQWHPYAVLEITFSDAEFTTDKIKRFYFMGFGLEKANFTDNINGFPNDDYVFQQVALDKDKLTLITRGQNGSEADTLVWQINIQ